VNTFTSFANALQENFANVTDETHSLRTFLPSICRAISLALFPSHTASVLKTLCYLFQTVQPKFHKPLSAISYHLLYYLFTGSDNVAEGSSEEEGRKGSRKRSDSFSMNLTEMAATIIKEMDQTYSLSGLRTTVEQIIALPNSARANHHGFLAPTFVKPPPKQLQDVSAAIRTVIKVQEHVDLMDKAARRQTIHLAAHEQHLAQRPMSKSPETKPGGKPKVTPDLTLKPATNKINLLATPESSLNPWSPEEEKKKNSAREEFPPAPVPPMTAQALQRTASANSPSANLVAMKRENSTGLAPRTEIEIPPSQRSTPGALQNPKVGQPVGRIPSNASNSARPTQQNPLVNSGGPKTQTLPWTTRPNPSVSTERIVKPGDAVRGIGGIAPMSSTRRLGTKDPNEGKEIVGNLMQQTMPTASPRLVESPSKDPIAKSPSNPMIKTSSTKSVPSKDALRKNKTSKKSGSKKPSKQKPGAALEQGGQRLSINGADFTDLKALVSGLDLPAILSEENEYTKTSSDSNSSIEESAPRNLPIGIPVPKQPPQTTEEPGSDDAEEYSDLLSLVMPSTDQLEWLRQQLLSPGLDEFDDSFESGSEDYESAEETKTTGFDLGSLAAAAAGLQFGQDDSEGSN